MRSRWLFTSLLLLVILPIGCIRPDHGIKMNADGVSTEFERMAQKCFLAIDEADSVAPVLDEPTDQGYVTALQNPEFRKRMAIAKRLLWEAGAKRKTPADEKVYLILARYNLLEAYVVFGNAALEVAHHRRKWMDIEEDERTDLMYNCRSEAAQYLDPGWQIARGTKKPADGPCLQSAFSRSGAFLK